MKFWKAQFSFWTMAITIAIIVVLAGGAGVLGGHLATESAWRAKPTPTAMVTETIETTVTPAPAPASTVTMEVTVTPPTPSQIASDDLPIALPESLDKAGIEINKEGYEKTLKCPAGFKSIELPFGGSLNVSGKTIDTRWLETEDDSQAALEVKFDTSLEIVGGGVLGPDNGAVFVLSDTMKEKHGFILREADYEDRVDSSDGNFICVKPK